MMGGKGRLREVVRVQPLESASGDQIPSLPLISNGVLDSYMAFLNLEGIYVYIAVITSLILYKRTFA